MLHLTFSNNITNKDTCKPMDHKVTKDNKQEFMYQLCPKWLEFLKLIIDVRAVRFLALLMLKQLLERLILIRQRKGL